LLVCCAEVLLEKLLATGNRWGKLFLLDLLLNLLTLLLKIDISK